MLCPDLSRPRRGELPHRPSIPLRRIRIFLPIISYQKRRRKAGFFLIISESVLRHFANLKICVIMMISILYSHPRMEKGSDVIRDGFEKPRLGRTTEKAQCSTRSSARGRVYRRHALLRSDCDSPRHRYASFDSAGDGHTLYLHLCLLCQNMPHTGTGHLSGGL